MVRCEEEVEEGEGRLFEVGEVRGVGRVLVARKNIKAGQEVLRETAAVAGPANTPSPVCVGCCEEWREGGREGGGRCGRCGWTVCGQQECRGAGWHSIECGVLASAPPGSPHCYAAILPLRLALLARRNDRLAARLNLLMDHREDLQDRQDFETKWLQPVRACLAHTDLTEEEILRGIGIFLTNAANMAPAQGRWIFPTFSFLSHSCVSNSRFFISPGGEVTVTAVVDIEAGQEVTISYCPPQPGNITRREKIQRLWQFLCQCERCQDGTELGTFLSGVKCRHCQTGTLTSLSSSLTSPSSPSSSLTADYHCGTEGCGQTVSSSTILALTNSLAAEVAQTQPENVLELIDKLESVLHTQHYLIMELRQRWVDITMEDTTNTRTEAELVRVVEFLQVITRVNSKIEPGYSVSLGTNLRHLNTAMLGLAKLRLQQQKIDKKEFMMIARKAAENIKIAKKCFENTTV